MARQCHTKALRTCALSASSAASSSAACAAASGGSSLPAFLGAAFLRPYTTFFGAGLSAAASPAWQKTRCHLPFQAHHWKSYNTEHD